MKPEPRRIDFGDDMVLEWHRRLPEFAAVANAVSIQMPHVEPYVALAVRSQVDQLSPALAAEAAGYVGQELEHHRQHRALNDVLIRQCPGLGRVDRLAGWMMARLVSRRDHDLGLAFAVAFEAMAYAGARWVDQRLHALLDGADGDAATLFVWHLAEEVEHASVADDVARAAEVGRPTRFAGALVALLVLAVCTMAGLVPQLWAQRRLVHPVTIARLVRWALSFSFVMLPSLVASAARWQHPGELPRPTWMQAWLAGYDPDTQTMPAWNELGASGSAVPHQGDELGALAEADHQRTSAEPGRQLA